MGESIETPASGSPLIISRSQVIKYGLALFSVGVVLAIRLLGWSEFRDEVPFLFFWSALAVTAWHGGFGPGLLATGSSAILIAFLFLPAFRDFRVPETVHIVYLCVFTVTGVLISWLMGQLHSARASSEEAGREAKLRAAEAEEGKRILQALMDRVPEGITIVDAAEGRIQRMSRFARELIGNDSRVIEGLPLESVLEGGKRFCRPDGSSAAGPEELLHLNSLRRGAEVTGEEWLLQRADGTAVSLLCDAVPFRDEGGKIAQGILTWHDISSRRSMEQSLRQAYLEMEARVRDRTAELARTSQDLLSEQLKLFSVLDTLPFFVCLIAPDHSIRFANQHFRALFGEFSSGACHLVMGGHGKPCTDCPPFRVFGTRSQAAWEWASPTGSYFEMHDYPFIERDGSMMVLEIGVDITERRKAEQALQLERSKLLKILGSMREAVYIVNQQNKIEYANPALELEFGPMPDRKCFEYLHERTDMCPWCKIPEVSAGKSVNWEWISSRTGKVFDVYETPLVNQDGSISKLKIMHDITALKRAEEERTRHHQRLENLWRISGKTDLDLGILYDHVLAEMLAMTQSRYGFLGFLNEDESTITIHSWSREVMEACRLDEDSIEYSVAKAGLWGEAVRKREVLIVNNYAANHPHKLGLPEGHIALIRLLVVPIISHGRAIILGAVANKEKEYTADDASQMNAFLSSAQAIIERKKAEEALRESRKQLQRLSSELLTAQEAERMRISRELHDELGQSLSLIKLRVGMIEKGLMEDQLQLREHCRSALSGIDQLIDGVRRLSRDLCPAILENLGLIKALQRLVIDTKKASGIQINMEMGDIDQLFSPQTHILLYRIFQESLTNIVKHSGAKEVTISAKRQNGEVFFQIEDNGKGMIVVEPATERRARSRSLGMAIMRERVRTLGATLEIRSQKGDGTRLSFAVPIEKKGGR